MAKGIALTLGLNAVDSHHYAGWDGKLNACEADAQKTEVQCKDFPDQGSNPVSGT